MQKRVNKCSRPGCSLLKRPASEIGHRLSSGDLDFGRVPTILRTGKSGSLSPHCTDNTIYAEHLLPFWCMAGRGRLCGQCRIKTLGAGSLTSFPGWQHFTSVVTPMLGNRVCPVCLYWAKSLGSWCLVPPSLPHEPFLCWLCSAACSWNSSELWAQPCAGLLNHGTRGFFWRPQTHNPSSLRSIGHGLWTLSHFLRQILLFLCIALAIKESFLLQHHCLHCAPFKV